MAYTAFYAVGTNKQGENGMIPLARFTQSQLNRFAAFALSYIAFGMVMYHWLEKFSWIDSLYFVVVTLATVGYGDLTPVTRAGRLFTAFYIVFGIVVFAAFARVMIIKVFERRQNKKKSAGKRRATKLH